MLCVVTFLPPISNISQDLLSVSSSVPLNLATRTAPVPAETLPIFPTMCSDARNWNLLNDYESELKQMLSLMTQEQPLVETSAEWATVRQTLNIMTAVFQKDVEYVGEVRKEVNKARQLRSTPVSQQVQFYKANITPILEQEQKAADEEVEIVKSAKARGVKLPEEFYRQYGLE